MFLVVKMRTMEKTGKSALNIRMETNLTTKLYLCCDCNCKNPICIWMGTEREHEKKKNKINSLVGRMAEFWVAFSLFYFEFCQCFGNVL